MLKSILLQKYWLCIIKIASNEKTDTIRKRESAVCSSLTGQSKSHHAPISSWRKRWAWTCSTHKIKNFRYPSEALPEIAKITGHQSSTDNQEIQREWSSVRAVEEDGLDHTWEDLGHMNAHDLRDHLWEVHACLQRLSLYKQIIGELVQLPHNLRTTTRGEPERKTVL